MPGSRRWWRNPDVGGLAVTLAFFAVMYRQAIFGGRHWLFGDNASYNFPCQFFVFDRFRHGGLTSPCLEMGLGFPLYAEPQAQCFYPLNTAFWPLADPLTGFTLKMLLHMLLATIGMYCLARSLGRKSLGATAAAVVMCGGSFMVYRVIHAPILFALAWLPWVVLLYLKALRKGSVLAFAGMIGCTAMQILSGHPQLSIYTAFACIILGAGTEPLAGESAWRHRGRIIGLVAGGYLGGALLATVQLAPTYELYLYGPRTAGADLGLMRQWGCSLRDLAVDVLGRAEAQYKWEKVAFPGSLAWVAIVCALFNLRHKPTRALLGLVLVGLIVSWSDTNPLYDILAYVPVINRFRASGRIGVLIILGAGLLLAQLLDDLPRERMKSALWSAAAVLGLFELVALATTGRIGLGPWVSADPVGWQLPALLLSLAGLGAAGLMPRLRPALPAILLLLTAAELLIFANGVNPAMTRQEWEQHPDQQVYRQAAVRCRETGGAFVRWRDGLPNNVSIVYGVPQARAYTPMASPALDLMNTLLFGPNTQAALAAYGVKWVATDEATARQQGLQVVDHVDKWVLAKNPLTVTTAYFPRELVPGELAAVAAAVADPAADLRDTAVVSPMVVGAQPVMTGGGEAKVLEETLTRIVVKTTTTQPNLLILTRLWTPNWRATVDGKPTEPETANAILMCVTVPAGEHTVELSYNSDMLRPAAVSLLLALLWIVWLITEIRRRRQALAR
ncbi:MAG: YfhO family protein [Bacteroidota bacterium]